MSLLKEIRCGLIFGEEYQEKINLMASEIEKLENKKQELTFKNYNIKLAKYRLEEIMELIEKYRFDKEINQEIIPRIIDKIVVKDKKEFKYCFKCGLFI